MLGRCVARGLSLTVAVLAAVTVAGEAGAAVVTWDLTVCDGNLQCGSLDGSDGNTRSFVAAGGQVLLARAFATSNTDGTGLFVRAFLGQFGGGLGGTAPGTVASGGDGDGGSNRHTVDNIGKRDLVVFRFPSAAYIPVSVFLSAFGDTDFTAFVGGDPGLTFDTFSGLSYPSLAANGFTEYTWPNADLFWVSPANNRTDSPDRLAGLNNLGVDRHGQWLIIGAWKDDTSPEDRFKIKTLTARVSEPGTLILGGLGLAALGAAVLRRRPGTGRPPLGRP